MDTTIEPPSKADLASILALVETCRLPIGGLEEHLGTALVARAQGRIVGSAGLEMYGECALLRSVAVAPQLRGRGLGQGLVRAALDLARGRGVRSVYLLTETAAEFFPRLGFQVVDRGSVPAAVQTSVEFTSACPVSALAMVATL
jgi:amino-acid N-acetyltransferase